jgi:hypothetical protein
LQIIVPSPALCSPGGIPGRLSQPGGHLPTQTSPSASLHCTALHCTALHCTALHCPSASLGGDKKTIYRRLKLSSAAEMRRSPAGHSAAQPSAYLVQPSSWRPGLSPPGSPALRIPSSRKQCGPAGPRLRPQGTGWRGEMHKYWKL